MTDSVFDLDGKTVGNLTVDLTGMEIGESITLENGKVTNFTVIDKAEVTLTLNNVTVTNTNIN